MMKIAQVVLIAVIAVGATLATQQVVGLRGAQAPQKETAFERVTRTNTLRCGYAIATPWFTLDPKTNKMSGQSFDVTNRVAEKIGLKVDWVEETGWGVAEQGLVTGRYDMVCGSVCVDPRRNRAALYSRPYEHAPIWPVVRKDDHRFDGDVEKINKPGVRIGVKNGHVFEFVAKEQFPNAQLIYANDLSDDTEFLLMLTSNKIDVAFSGQITVDQYNKANGEVVRSTDRPARYCDGGFMMGLGEHNLKQMIDNALMELNTSGELERITARYMPVHEKYVRLPAQPFR
ncbi:MAG: amino acid ABC transporter substrate-binding protein [Alphaproteobacteria bacterium]|nr:amino acid ABC transporter substrate-binding protein [Alphaproteobacteria bacterium]